MMPFSEKKRIVLQYLYEHKFDGKVNGFDDILRGKGCDSNPQETYLIAQSLEDDGLIKSTSSMGGGAGWIIGLGVEYIENGYIIPDSIYINDNSFTPEEKELILKKLDDLKKDLEAIKMGQEILYEEIESLKELLHILKKDDWTKVFVGSLVSWEMGQLYPEIVEFIHNNFPDITLLNP